MGSARPRFAIPVNLACLVSLLANWTPEKVKITKGFVVDAAGW